MISATSAGLTGASTPVFNTSGLVTLPTLQFTGWSWKLGMRQHSDYGENVVSVVYPVTQALTVNLTTSDQRVATVPATVTIPAGGSATTFRVTAHDAAGAIQVIATATGYAMSSQTVQVTQPELRLWAPNYLFTTMPKVTLGSDGAGLIRHLSSGERGRRRHARVTDSGASPG